jgi:hypothetical protein
VRDPQREAAAAEVAGLRVDHREHQRHGDRGVGRVAAALEDLEAGLRRQRVLAGDRAGARAGPARGLLELLAARAAGAEQHERQGERPGPSGGGAHESVSARRPR